MKIRSLIVINALATVALIFLWTVPRAGFVMVAVALMVLPPWGRSYAQRAVISGLVLVGVIAVVFPRAGALPIDQLWASVFFWWIVGSSDGVATDPESAGVADASGEWD
jgi:hypothetical protein